MAELTPKTIAELPLDSTLPDTDLLAVSSGGAAKRATFGAVKQKILDAAQQTIVPDIKTYSSVTKLGLTSGSATIAQVWAALNNNEALVCNSNQFANAQVPAAGTVDILKDSNGGGWVLLHAADDDYHMTVSGTSISGTWETMECVEDIVYIENLGTTEFTISAHQSVNVVPNYVASPTIPDGYTALVRGARAQGDARVVSAGIGGFWLTNTMDQVSATLHAYAWAIAVKKKGGST